MPWQVKFFQTQRGSYPVKDFIDKQEIAVQSKINSHIFLLITYGPFLKPPYSKKLQSNLYELRITGKIAVRIFYTLMNNQYYLLHAFKKKSNKTPTKEIHTALDRLKEVI